MVRLGVFLRLSTVRTINSCSRDGSVTIVESKAGTAKEPVGISIEQLVLPEQVGIEDVLHTHERTNAPTDSIH